MALRLIAVIAFSLVINTLVNGKLSTWEDIGLTDQEYRDSLGREYIFFEITEPEQLAFTYKVRGQQFGDNPKHKVSLRRTQPPSPRPGTTRSTGSSWWPPIHPAVVVSYSMLTR